MKNLLAGTITLGLLTTTGVVQGAPISNVETQADFASLSTTDGAGNLLITGDLLTTATPDTAMPANMSNDVLGAGVAVDDGEVSVAGAGPYTYAFASAVNIAQIDVYSAWQDFRAGQDLDILVSGDGVNFTFLFNANVTSAGNEVNLTQITDDTNPFLATNVTHIQFAPQGDISGPGVGGVYREIDVIGEIVPEPGSLALLGLGGLLFARRRRG